MEVVLDRGGLGVPSEQSAVMTSSEQDEVSGVVNDTHNIGIMRLRPGDAFVVNERPVFIPGNTNHIIASIFFRLLHAVITPDTHASIPAYSCKLGVGVLVFVIGLEHATKAGYFSVDFLAPLDRTANGLLSFNGLQALTVREIPDFTVTAFRSSDESTGGRIEASSRDLGLALRSSLILRHQLTVLNIPDSDVTALISAHNGLEFGIK